MATYLIALLRAANIPARYVMGQVRVPFGDVINWVGAKDQLAALSILDIATAFIAASGDSIRFDHVWVEAYVPTGQGEPWVALDPSFKLKTYQPGIQIPQLPFDPDSWTVFGKKASRAKLPREDLMKAYNDSILTRFVTLLFERRRM